MMTVIAAANRLFRQLLGDTGGNFAIMTALLTIPLTAVAGAAVDLSTAYGQRTNLQEIADGAALAGGKIFDGTNLAAASAEAQRFITSYAATTPTNLSYTMTSSDRIFQVKLTGAVPTSLMRIAGISNLNVSVLSQATAPAKPDTVTITPTQAQGYYYKVITIRVTRAGASSETVVGTVTYQPTTHNNQGQGTMTVSPSGVISLGTYTKLALQMDIKDDGCPLGKKATISSSNAVTCKSSASAGTSYDLTLRTDNPATSNYLFVNGTQLPQGVTLPIENYFGCQSPQNHAWEDGGGWDRQDIFYTISSSCSSADGDAVRLTQ